MIVPGLRTQYFYWRSTSAAMCDLTQVHATRKFLDSDIND